MGLDSYWVKEQKFVLEFDPPLHLCGGIFSSPEAGSFRGKMYNELIENISGISLYQLRISNEDVRQIAYALDRAGPEDLDGLYYELEERELEDLRRMFRAYADEGAAILGWW